jgi:hypothetical protein
VFVPAYRDAVLGILGVVGGRYVQPLWVGKLQPPEVAFVVGAVLMIVGSVLIAGRGGRDTFHAPPATPSKSEDSKPVKGKVGGASKPGKKDVTKLTKKAHSMSLVWAVYPIIGTAVIAGSYLGLSQCNRAVPKVKSLNL